MKHLGSALFVPIQQICLHVSQARMIQLHVVSHMSVGHINVRQTVIVEIK